MQFSNELVKIPSELGFLTDYTELGYSQSGHLVQGTYPIINGVRQKVPRFLLQVDANYQPVIQRTTMNEFATSFLSEVAPKNITVDPLGIVTADEAKYTLNNDGTMSKVIAKRPIAYFTSLVAFGGVTVGMTVADAIKYFGAEFIIHTLSYTNPDGTDSGLVTLENADPAGKINGKTTYWGYAVAERVLKDCIASNMYSRSRTSMGKFLAGNYPWLRLNSTVDALPAIVTTHGYMKRPVTNSVIPYLYTEAGKVKASVFVNKQVYTGGKITNPAGYEFTPTFVLMLTNGGPDQTAGGYSLRARAQSVVHMTSFSEYNLVALTDDREGYIDQATSTIFYNPNKPAIVRLEVTQARIGDIMGKTWAVEGAVNIQTGVWSKFYETL